MFGKHHQSVGLPSAPVKAIVFAALRRLVDPSLMQPLSVPEAIAHLQSYLPVDLVDGQNFDLRFEGELVQLVFKPTKRHWFVVGGTTTTTIAADDLQAGDRFLAWLAEFRNQELDNRHSFDRDWQSWNPENELGAGERVR